MPQTLPRTLPLSDRIRIERTVSLLDTYLSDLPRKSRVAKRREVRANLRDAAADIGTAEALRNLGSPRDDGPPTGGIHDAARERRRSRPLRVGVQTSGPPSGNLVKILS